MFPHARIILFLLLKFKAIKIISRKLQHLTFILSLLVVVTGLFFTAFHVQSEKITMKIG